MQLRRIALALFLLSSSRLAHATTLASSTGGASTIGGSYYTGQSFNVVGSGGYNNITFNYYAPAGGSYALGTGYLLSSLYAGTPSGLSSGTAGYLGSVTASGGLYSFGSSVMLVGGSEYYFYEDAVVPTGALTGNTAYAGGAFYFASSSTSTYLTTTSANFLVTGNSLSSVTPEPSGLALLGTGLLGVVGVVRRRLA